MFSGGNQELWEHGKLETFKTFSIFFQVLSCGGKMFLFEFQCDYVKVIMRRVPSSCSLPYFGISSDPFLSALSNPYDMSHSLGVTTLRKVDFCHIP